MSNLTYTTGRPAGNLTPAQNRPSMQTNNDSAAAIWDEDHYGFNDNNGGLHQQVTLPNIQADPSPLPTGDASVLYSKLVSSVPQLFFANSGGVNQLTGLNSSVVTHSLQGGAGNYSIITLGGIRFWCGQVGAASGGVNYTLQVGDSFGTVYAYVATTFGGSTGGCGITVGSSTSFNLATANSSPRTWLIITS